MTSNKSVQYAPTAAPRDDLGFVSMLFAIVPSNVMPATPGGNEGAWS
jgi:hypothetical protein